MHLLFSSPLGMEEIFSSTWRSLSRTYLSEELVACGVRNPIGFAMDRWFRIIDWLCALKKHSLYTPTSENVEMWDSIWTNIVKCEDNVNKPHRFIADLVEVMLLHTPTNWLVKEALRHYYTNWPVFKTIFTRNYQFQKAIATYICKHNIVLKCTFPPKDEISLFQMRYYWRLGDFCVNCALPPLLVEDTVNDKQVFVSYAFLRRIRELSRIREMACKTERDASLVTRCKLFILKKAHDGMRTEFHDFYNVPFCMIMTLIMLCDTLGGPAVHVW
jgi:hypothetical protein